MLCCVYGSHFHLAIEEHLDCFNVLAIVNVGGWAMDFGEQVSGEEDGESFARMRKSDKTSSLGGFSGLISSVATSFAWQRTRVLFFTHSCQNFFLLVVLLILGILTEVR